MRYAFARLAVLTLLAGCGDDGDSTADAGNGADAAAGPPTVAIVFAGRGDNSFNDMAAAGADRAAEELGVAIIEVEEQDFADPNAAVEDAASRADLVIAVGFIYTAGVEASAAAHADVSFAIVDSPIEGRSNVSSLLFAAEQGSFLVGAAAALKSTSGHIGYIGGVGEFPVLFAFQAGYAAGARRIDPDIQIDEAFLSVFPDFSGFDDPEACRAAAEQMYTDGADVVYHAAGGSGFGLFDAAESFSAANGTQVWAIGVDSDQYLAASEAQQPYVLTSMMKRVDVAVFSTIQQYLDGDFVGDVALYDLARDGVGYARSGGFVDDIADQLDGFADAIISGEIVVPTVPGQ